MSPFIPPRFLPHGLAFVDIETTGGPTQRESITEIGIIEVSESGVREWSTLVRPEMRIPDHIRRLTGISDDMVANAPRFADIADELYDRLDGRLFIAHNARFDHGHIRAAFRRIGMDIRPRVLCTVRLSRRLMPEQRRHSLDQLIARHGLSVAARHRALGDAHLLWQFWQALHDRFPAGAIDEAVADLTGRPTLPPHLDPADIDAIPEAPGVYLFFGDNALPLYIGKSTRMRTRVLSHFSADHSSERELRLSQQVRRIEWIRTGGEIGALLKEAELIKRMQPTMNRRLRRNRDLCAWQFEPDLIGDLRPRLVRAGDLDFGGSSQLFGFFRSQRAATERLRTLAREHALCPTLMGLEAPAGGARCFNHQLRRCRGACAGQEALADHHARMLEALAELKVEHWPYAGPIGLCEGDDIHVVDRWCHFGSAGNLPAAQALLESGQALFDLDIYRILVRALQQTAPSRVIALEGASVAA